MKNLILFATVLAMACLTTLAQKPAAMRPFSTSGFYDGIEMTSKESGDYGGISVYLTQSSDRTFALVSIAEGAMMAPVLVPVTVSGKDMRTVEFVYDSPNYGRKLTLRGTVRSDGLLLAGFDEKPKLLKRKCTNTYSDISVGKESGDYGGTEVYLTDAGGSWYALVSTAEGELRPPVLVPAKVTGKDFDRIEFVLSGDPARKFTGTLSRRLGTLNLDEQGTKTTLKRKCYE